jgi:hypothetical protein
LKIWWVIFLGLVPLTGHAQSKLELGQFSAGEIADWQENSFAGQTRYDLVELEGRQVIHADSMATASAFYLPVKVDLNKTPNLHWTWRKRVAINPGEEKTKAGDDFVARVYVIKKGGVFFWNTKAINYVWSSNNKKNDHWANPFAGDNAQMLVLRNEEDPGHQWFKETRNVKQDFSQLFGKDVDQIDGIAIMTDSDNSGSKANAYYGDIYFSE